MRGHTNFLGGVEKIEGARLSGGLLQRGVYMIFPWKLTIGGFLTIVQEQF